MVLSEYADVVSYICSLQAILAAAPPVLVTGYEGMESVALVVACIRKVQCWDNSSIQDELGRAIQLVRDFPQRSMLHAEQAPTEPGCGAYTLHQPVL